MMRRLLKAVDPHPNWQIVSIYRPGFPMQRRHQVLVEDHNADPAVIIGGSLGPNEDTCTLDVLDQIAQYEEFLRQQREASRGYNEG